MGTARSAGLADRHEQLGVGTRHLQVVAGDWQRVDDVVQERPTRLSALAGGDLNAYAEFGYRDGRDGGLVVVGDQRVQVEG